MNQHHQYHHHQQQHRRHQFNIMDSAATTIQSKCLWSFLLIVTFMCNGTFSDMGKMSSSQNHFGNTAQSQFATKNNTRVIAQKGGLAILPCVVKLNSPATVSWIRRKDFQLLTVGLSTHSSDKRFLVEHTRHMGHWSLRIKSVREDDRGFYECQLSIYPTQSIFIELKVVEAVAEITGAPDLHIDEGSALRLECKLKRATENPAFVFWYHDNKMVNYDSQDGFSVTSTAENLPPSLDGGGSYIGSGSSLRERGGGGGGSSGGVGASNNNNNHSSHTNGHLSSLASLMAAQQHQSSYLLTPSTSVLTIQEVHFHHAGNYTCAPSNARPASITVHVLRGEKPAAMQHANRSVLDSEISNSSSGGSGGGSVSTSGAYSISGPNRLALGCAVKLRQVTLVLQQICQQLYQHYQRQQQQQQQQQQPLEKQQERQQHWSPGSLTWLLAIVTLICAYHKIDR